MEEKTNMDSLNNTVLYVQRGIKPPNIDAVTFSTRIGSAPEGRR